jgi:hypothetical protein
MPEFELIMKMAACGSIIVWCPIIFLVLLGIKDEIATQTAYLKEEEFEEEETK